MAGGLMRGQWNPLLRVEPESQFTLDVREIQYRANAVGTDVAVLVGSSEPPIIEQFRLRMGGRLFVVSKLDGRWQITAVEGLDPEQLVIYGGAARTPHVVEALNFCARILDELAQGEV